MVLDEIGEIVDERARGKEQAARSFIIKKCKRSLHFLIADVKRKFTYAVAELRRAERSRSIAHG